MTVEAFRLQNFMAFKDTGWIEITPISLFFGRNSSGKSAIIRAVRLLKQSLNLVENEPILKFVAKEQLDLGDFMSALHKHGYVDGGYRNDREFVDAQKITVAFRCRLIRPVLEQLQSRLTIWCHEKGYKEFEFSPQDDWIEIFLSYSYDNIERGKPIKLVGIDITAHWGKPDSVRAIMFISGSKDETIYHDEQNIQSQIEWSRNWYWDEDAVLGNWMSQTELLWNEITLSTATSFLPVLTNLLNLPISSDPAEAKSDYDILGHTLKDVNGSIRGFLSSIHYLGPLRPFPERTYTLKSTQVEEWRLQGLSAYIDFLSYASVLPNSDNPDPITARNKLSNFYGDKDLPDASLRQYIVPDRPAEETLEYWLTKFGLCESYRILPQHVYSDGSVVASVQLSDGNNIWSHLTEVGAGATQLIPIIVTCLLAQRGEQVIVEQPELHLHPKAQLELGNLFISTAKRGINVVVETHSEHLMLRLRSYIAEVNLKLLQGDRQQTSKQDFSPTDLSIFFISKLETHESILCKITTNEYGDFIDQPDGFKDFFADDATEVMKITRAALEAEQIKWNEASE